MCDQVTLRPVRAGELPMLESLTWDPEIAGEPRQPASSAEPASLPTRAGPAT